ncbi:hypothetical protein PFISCL1PPCAC_17105 [Pristionchus fissidentatus]|uniref:Uncharacterized protein n=1 Tax=Pristionchus fissidentatus TaxID=1538716 RepID=A0AAV5W508_9BILA|nr:hypothetical protein PFISCL1PPCAC_17105 [Pristionchus fissidentatus]
MQALLVLCAAATASAQFFAPSYGYGYTGYGFPSYGYGSYGYPSIGYGSYGYPAAYPAYGYGLVLATPALAAHTIVARDTSAVAIADVIASTSAPRPLTFPRINAGEEKISVIQKRDTSIDVKQESEEADDKTSVIQKKE